MKTINISQSCRIVYEAGEPQVEVRWSGEWWHRVDDVNINEQNFRRGVAVMELMRFVIHKERIDEAKRRGVKV